MMRSLFSGVAGLKAYQTGMDVIGNNIANVNTYGFKSSRTTYRDVYYQTLSGSSASNATSSIGGGNPVQIGYGATAATVDVLNTRSGMATTGRPTDCYIDGEGYFIVKDGSGYLYTRVGSLGFDGDGNLIDGNKKIICGSNVVSGALVPLPNATTGEVTAPAAIKVADYKDYTNITIGSDGKITGEKGGTVTTLGSIALANIPNPDALTLQGGSYLKPVSNTGTSTYYTPGSGATGSLVTSALESSNVDLANEFSQMIITERGFQANSKIITVSDEMLEDLVNLKR
ncbi:flagellar hook-basal body complex protein [Caproiciproducens sp. CPB-2]|uniref:flagellar hook-basal body complex protein n=1 Tax=unclassified Caproiciproducens TaxID=2643836 RepID=UPI0023DBB094|nr:flagellar hook-basal body complex protein [Caproiciproducens sp. CPB-2]MDF1494245.1 flagellar hook-basal body complex protein [Caproiciproducens sp. CPB-2]